MIGILLSGSTKLLGFESITVFVLAGVSFVGFGIAMIAVPVMPEIIDSINSSKFAGNIDEVSLHNNLAGYFITCQAIGESSGPLFAAIAQTRFGFRDSQFIQVSCVAIFLVAYYFSCDFRRFFKLENTTTKDQDTNDGY